MVLPNLNFLAVPLNFRFENQKSPNINGVPCRTIRIQFRPRHHFRLPPAGVALLARPPFWTKSRYELEEAQRAVNAKGAGGQLRDGHRFFDRVGHETTYASSGNKHLTK